TGECTQDVLQGHAVVRAMLHRYVVAGLQLTLVEHSKVAAWPAFRGEPLDPLRLVNEALEHRAGDPRGIELDPDRADPPAFTDRRVRQLDAFNGEVLAELAVTQVTAQHRPPPVEVLSRVRIEGLLGAAVIGLVGLLVGHQPQRRHADRSGLRLLVDRRALQIPPRHSLGAARVDREKPSSRHTPTLLPPPGSIDPFNSSAPGLGRLGLAGERRDEGFLRYLDPANHLHPLLAFFLLLQQLPFAGDVTAITLGEDVLAQGADALAGDDPRPDGSLDRHLKLLARNELFEPLRHRDAVGVRLVLVNDGAERVDRLTVEQDVDLHEGGRLLA